MLTLGKILTRKYINIFMKKRKKPKAEAKRIDLTPETLKSKETGSTATIEELNSNKVIDRKITYYYKFEETRFHEQEDFKTEDGYYKYIAKTNDIYFDIVANDLMSKDFNSLKTFVTFNTGILKFRISFDKTKPLRSYVLVTKRLEGLYPKQKEGYNLTGGNREYHTIQVMIDMSDKTETYANIFTSFVYLKAYIISVLSNIAPLDFSTLFKTLFVRQNKRRKKMKFKVRLNGYKAKIKIGRKRLRKRYKKYTNKPKRMTKKAYRNWHAYLVKSKQKLIITLKLIKKRRPLKKKIYRTFLKTYKYI